MFQQVENVLPREATMWAGVGVRVPCFSSVKLAPEGARGNSHVDAVVLTAEVFVDDGSQNVRVDASNVLVGAPDGQGVDPVSPVDVFEDLGEVLVGDVEDGKAGFVVLVDNEISIDSDCLVVAFLEKQGDGSKGLEGDLPFLPAFAWWGGRLQVVKRVLVDERPRILGFTAFGDNRFDHVPVGKSFVPQSPESMELFV
jgi:hypothetical protein